MQHYLLTNRKPVKAAIAATAEYVSGLLPPHLVYSHAHETAIEVCCLFIFICFIICKQRLSAVKYLNSQYVNFLLLSPFEHHLLNHTLICL